MAGGSTGVRTVPGRALTDAQRNELRHTSAHRIMNYSQQGKMSKGKKILLGLVVLALAAVLALYGDRIFAKAEHPAPAAVTP